MRDRPKYQYRKAPYLGFVAENNCCGLHLHRHAEISYVTEGERTFYIDDVPYTMHAGDLILVFPNQLHYLEVSGYCREICSIFDSNLTSDFAWELNSLHLDNCLFHKEELDASTLTALNCLANSGISKSYKAHSIPYMEQGFLSVILANLFRKRRLLPYPVGSPSQIITGFFSYIENHLAAPLETEEIAQALHISRQALNSNIRFYTAKTPHQHVKERRLDVARTMLIQTNKPIQQIATETGFKNERSFFRNFQEMYQKSPAQLRQKKCATTKNTGEVQ